MNKKTEIDKTCFYLDCQDKVKQGFECCEYHLTGGVFGSGESYEQYQIIEQDFIDFMKVVPLNDEKHFKIHSPVLRDIIIRACVEIEIFFKEWAKQICSKDKDTSLWKEYNKLRKGEVGKERNWTIGSYYYFYKIGFVRDHNSLYVRILDKKICPFEGWESAKEPPLWWSSYNAIKHNGLLAKKEATYENALHSVAALFLLHCLNRHSRHYLREHTLTTINTVVETVSVQTHLISTPIDTRLYLFSDTSGIRKKIELVTHGELKKKSNKSSLF